MIAFQFNGNGAFLVINQGDIHVHPDYLEKMRNPARYWTSSFQEKYFETELDWNLKELSRALMAGLTVEFAPVPDEWENWPLLDQQTGARELLS